MPPQTVARSSVLGTTRPRARIRCSSRANSRAGSSTGTPPRATVRAAGSSTRSPTTTSPAGSAAPAPSGAPQQRLEVRDDDDPRERLGEVVVGAEVQAVRLVVLAVLGREHEDRDL